MNIPLIHGEFSSADTLDLLTTMLRTKIKFHENKITNTSSEEDIKYRESKIKKLQDEILVLKHFTDQTTGKVKIDVDIMISAQ